MAKKTEQTEQKERISIVISREDKKHLGFIALERDLPSAGDAVSYVLSHFDRSGKLKRQKDMISPGTHLPLETDAGEPDYIPTL